LEHTEKEVFYRAGIWDFGLEEEEKIFSPQRTRRARRGDVYEETRDSSLAALSVGFWACQGEGGWVLYISPLEAVF
jgi:hypothetical protein